MSNYQSPQRPSASGEILLILKIANTSIAVEQIALEWRKTMAHTITKAKQIQKKSRHCVVRQVRSNWFKVTDEESKREYDVNLGLNGGTCTCAWGRYRPPTDHRSGCAHVVAAMNYRAKLHGQRISVWTSEQEARRQHRPMVAIGDGLVLTSRRH